MALERGPGGAVIREVRGADSPYLPAAVDLFLTVFPEEAHYAAYVRECALQNSPSHPATYDHLWLVEQQGRPVGVRIFSYVHTRNFGHGGFIGILPGCRSQGLGAWLVRQTLAQLCADAAAWGRDEPSGYCIEVEPVEEAKDEAARQEAERRLAFHRRCGALVLDVDYMEPPMIEGASYITPGELAGVEPARMLLMFVPTRPLSHVSRRELIDIVEGTYIDVYRLAPDSWYMRQALASIEAREQRHGRA